MKITIERRADQPSKFFAYEDDKEGVFIDGKQTIEEIWKKMRGLNE